MWTKWGYILRNKSEDGDEMTRKPDWKTTTKGSVLDAKCNKCGKIFQTLSEAFDCNKSHDQEGQEILDVTYTQVEPIEYIEVSIEVPKRSGDKI